MEDEYPADSDGDALRRVARHGSDMSRPMVIDFPVVFATEESAKLFAAVVVQVGYKAHLWKHDDDAYWDVVCAKEMAPVYNDIVNIQKELTEQATPFGGVCECWGTFGNKSPDLPRAT